MNFSFNKPCGIYNEINCAVPMEPLAKRQSRSTTMMMEEKAIFLLFRSHSCPSGYSVQTRDPRISKAHKRPSNGVEKKVSKNEQNI